MGRLKTKLTMNWKLDHKLKSEIRCDYGSMKLGTHGYGKEGIAKG